MVFVNDNIDHCKFELGDPAYESWGNYEFIRPLKGREYEQQSKNKIVKMSRKVYVQTNPV